jgi:hypothetical protein
LNELQRELDVNYCHLVVISTDPPPTVTVKEPAAHDP